MTFEHYYYVAAAPQLHLMLVRPYDSLAAPTCLVGPSPWIASPSTEYVQHPQFKHTKTHKAIGNSHTCISDYQDSTQCQTKSTTDIAVRVCNALLLSTYITQPTISSTILMSAPAHANSNSQRSQRKAYSVTLPKAESATKTTVHFSGLQLVASKDAAHKSRRTGKLQGSL